MDNSDYIERTVKRLIEKITEPEEYLMELLKDNYIVFEFQKALSLGGKFVVVDFFIETKDKKGLVIEIDGAYHFKRKQRKKDRKRSDWIEKNFGCHFRRFSNKYAVNKTQYLVDIIKSYGPIIYNF